VPTNPMLSAGHMGIVDAHKYGPTRDDATVAAALGAIAGEYKTLLLPFTGDGLWILNNPTTFPTNVTLHIPPGVRIGGAGNLTIDCQLFSYTDQWYVGTGSLIGAFRTTVIGALEVQRLGINLKDPAAPFHLVGGLPAAPNAIMILEDRGGPGAAYISFVSGLLQRGALGLSGTNNILLTLQNTANFSVLGGNIGLGTVTPGVQLTLSTGGAEKATGTTWSNPSDSRIKTVQRPYTDGLSVIAAMQPYWLQFNGLAGTDATIPEFVSVLAQEVEAIAPYMISSVPAKLHPEDEEETDILRFDASALIFTLVNAVKELATRLEALEHPQTSQQRGAAETAASETRPAARKKSAGGRH
jgi:hypothetical protein